MNTIKAIYQSPQTRHIIKTGIAAIISVLVYQLFHLPYGYWAVITTVIIMQSNIESGSFEVTIKLAFQRFAGTLSGALVGFAIILLLQPSEWMLLIAVFCTVLLGCYLTKLYSGFTMFAATAIIILLLAHQMPPMHNFGWLRVVDIMIGGVIAVAVTLLIWPYRVKDHLGDNRQQRLTRIRQQFIDLKSAIQHHAALSANWSSQQQDLMRLNKADETCLNLLTSNDKTQASTLLANELQLIRFLTRLGEVLPGVSVSDWQAGRLQKSRVALVFAMITALSKIETQKELTQSNLQRDIHHQAAQHQKDFEAFRAFYRQQQSKLDIEQIYQLFTVFQALQTCAEALAHWIDGLTTL